MNENQIKECNKELSKDNILLLGSGNFKKYYVSGAYIKQRLNEVFGVGNWSYTYELSTIKSYNQGFDKNINVGFMAKVILTLNLKEKDLVLNEVGTSQLLRDDYMNQDKARKGAITDGLKRCSVNLGKTFGLGIMARVKELKL